MIGLQLHVKGAIAYVVMENKAINLRKARKILGKLAENISDDELEKELQTARLLKDLFFSFNTRNKKPKGL